MTDFSRENHQYFDRLPGQDENLGFQNSFSSSIHPHNFQRPSYDAYNSIMNDAHYSRFNRPFHRYEASQPMNNGPIVQGKSRLTILCERCGKNGHVAKFCRAQYPLN